MAARSKIPRDPPTATVLGRQRTVEGRPEVIAPPRRLFACPNCGAAYVVEPTGEPAPEVLHFDFACTAEDCGYKAAVGLR